MSDARFSRAIIGGYINVVESKGNTNVYLDDYITNLPLKDDALSGKVSDVKAILQSLVTITDY